MKKYIALTLCGGLFLLAGTAAAASTWDSVSKGVSDAAESTAQAAGDLAEKASGFADDSTITGVVKGKLAFRKGLEGSDISVSTDKRVVTLSGSVLNETQSILAEKVAEEVRGVASVNNMLAVAGGDKEKGVGDYLADANVTAHVKTRFLGQSGLDSLDIGVRTESGVVTLEGQVDSAAQVVLAEKVAHEVGGVKAVVNRLSVKPGAGKDPSLLESAGAYLDDTGLTTAVKGKLLTQKGIDSLDISVKTEKGVVTLSGAADNDAQAALAEKVAWEVKGVKGVVNTMTVKEK